MEKIDNLKCVNSEEVDAWLWHHCQVLGNIADGIKDDRGINVEWLDRNTGESIKILWEK